MKMRKTMNIQRSNMKKLYFTIMALMVTLVASAQTIKVYEYNEKGELNTTPAYTSNKQVKVVFVDHDYVDLGLPSGTLWATCNVGANSPEEYGDYFAWGETTPKDTYDWSTYKWCSWNGSEYRITKYCKGSYYGRVDDKRELDPEDDAATANWGSDWRMPTISQLNELYNSSYTTKEWTTLNGVNGRLITSKKNGNTLFLPAAGYSWGGSPDDAGSNGNYWSRSLSLYSNHASRLLFSSGNRDWDYYYRNCGLSVRPVRLQN